MKNSQKGFMGLLILIIVALLAGGGGYYIYKQKQETPSTSQNYLEEENNQDNSEAIIRTNTIVNCDSEDCFQPKFTACQPATLKANADFAAVDYKIIEPVNGGCKVTFKYTTNPNPDWVNKEMTCTFDNRISFQKSIENVFAGVVNGSVVCSGPLYNILRPV